MLRMLSTGLALLMWFLPAAHAQTPATTQAGAANVQDISDLLDTVRTAHPVPGIVAAVVHADGLAAAGASGVRRAGSDVKVTIDDQFHIGSCTKAMTATLAAMFVEDGKLRWDSTVRETFPDIADKMDPAWSKVTLEQLLSHRGGVTGGMTNETWWPRVREPAMTPTRGRRLILETVTSRPPDAPPGSHHIYSSAGYAIAGAMIEQVAGEPWERLMRQRLFDPLNMTTAGFGPPGKPDSLDQPWGHTEAGQPVAPGPSADNPPAIGPAGTVHCSVTDWAKFAALHLAAERGQPRLLKAETFAKLHTPVKGRNPGEPDYALGWTVAARPWAGGSTLNHAGTNTIWYAIIWIAPKRDLAVLVACNQGGKVAQQACDETVWKLVQRAP